MKKATFPGMGHYTEVFKYLAEELGFEVIMPKTTQETIKLGVRQSSDMVCFPFKSTLGNLIQGLEDGAEVIIVLGMKKGEETRAICRFGFYYYIQEQILRRLGYTFEMIYLDDGIINILKSLKNTSSHISYYKLFKILFKTRKKIKEVEEREFKFERKDINIGLVGEIYTLLEHNVNYDIINKLKKMGVGVHLSLDLSWFLKHKLHMTKQDKGITKELKKYFPKRIGGHGYESLYNTIWYAKNNFDGVIHLLPLSCMPETLVEMPMNMIGEDYNIPIYRFPIDENRYEVGFDTRLETFIKLLRRKKNE